MKYKVLNRYTGKVQFTADIDCKRGEDKSIKLGLAVKWAVENGANLRNADLEDANLWDVNLRNADLEDANLGGANLRDANLGGANLRDADLEDADLEDADLRNANLRDANLGGANLRDADLEDADLEDADLRYANLRDANLGGANLRDANLRGVDLRGVDLRGVDLWGVVGDKTYIKTLQLDTYSVSYTSEIMQIGCESHSIEDWWKFKDKEILAMDGKKALTWWKKWKPVLKQIIKTSPAEPTMEAIK